MIELRENASPLDALREHTGDVRSKLFEFIVIREPLLTCCFKISHLIHALKRIGDNDFLRIDFHAALFLLWHCDTDPALGVQRFSP